MKITLAVNVAHSYYIIYCQKEGCYRHEMEMFPCENKNMFKAILFTLFSYMKTIANIGLHLYYSSYYVAVILSSCFIYI